MNAPDPLRLAATAHLRPRGSSQGGMRQYNERVVLQAIRLHGPCASAEIARLTQLTAQTISLITKRLLEEGLLLKGEPQRGKVGQPSVPLRLNPDGAFAVGIKVGRRSMDMLLVDFTGEVRQRLGTQYLHADPDHLLKAIAEQLTAMRQALGPEGFSRVQGLGLAAPLAMEGWQQLLGFPTEVAQRWQAVDLPAEVASLANLPVHAVKDTAAACLAELVRGRGRGMKSFLYLFLDTFIGGALVLDSQLHLGMHGNAGAVGSLPLALARAAGGQMPAQLLSVASLLNLQQSYAAAGLDVDASLDDRALQPPWQAFTEQWLDSTAAAIAHLCNVSVCLLDVPGVILDGSFSPAVRARLSERTHLALDRYAWEGVTRPVLFEGAIGSDARALGGAWLPLHAQFAPDRELFLKIDG
jgi:predicted NBD/HSP70 family sugar kinase